MTITEKNYPILKETVIGWMVEEKMKWFEKIYEEIKPSVCVELGVFYGLSAIAQGVLIKEFGLDCKLYAVDAWSKTASTEGSNSQENNEWWAKLDHTKAFNSFSKHIKDFGLENIVIPIVGKSQDVSHMIPDSIDILHADGNHAFEIVSKEIEIYAPQITNGGYWIADDFKWKEMGGATNKLIDYGFSLIFEYNDNGQSFAIYKKQ